MSVPQLGSAMSGQQNRVQDKWGAGGFIRFGLVCVLILGGGFGGWAATASLSGAVIAGGQLRVQTNKQVVQHPDGGVVGEIIAREGDRVEAGQVLIRLDDTLLKSELTTVESQLYEVMARRGRLEAMITDKQTVTFDPELVARAGDDPGLSALMEGQRALFHARKESSEKEMQVLEERKLQLAEQIVGTEAEIESLITQTALIEQELAQMQRLLDKGLIEVSRVLALQREQARLAGQAGQLRSRVAQLRGQISEITLQQSQMKSAQLEEAIAESRELGFRELELKERQLSFIERLSRLDIRAPAPGVVIDSTVHAIKSVVRPADDIMFIVPSDATLVVDARVEPTDIDDLWVGQECVLRFSSLNARTTPEIFGEIVNISADVIVDEATGLSYYKAEVRLRDGELEKLEDQELIAGMPVETFIQTGSRTPLAYMMKPITDYFTRAMREK